MSRQPLNRTLYKRVLLKLSGESLTGPDGFGINHQAAEKLAKALCELYSLGLQIGVVIGGGNIFRGELARSFGFARTPADHIGMLATAINGLALSQVISSCGVETQVMSAIDLGGFVDLYNWKKAIEYLGAGKVVIFVAGTGNPYFTTDTAAAMRSIEIDADVLIKATKVDGIYDKDPHQDSSATKFDTLTFDEVLTQNLKVMDAAAIALCRDHNLPIHVVDVFDKEALKKAMCSKEGGTYVSKGA